MTLQHGRDIDPSSDCREGTHDSGSRYRKLFESIDEGFCIVEVIFDPNGRAIDYRFLETNPSFTDHTGLIDVVGRRVREINPRLEEFWFETYGEIALTGVPSRFTKEAVSLNRWFDVYAFRVDEPEQHHVAALFRDITGRRRAEQNTAFLAEIGAVFSRLSGSQEIMRTAGEMVRRHFDASSVFFSEIDSTAENITIVYDLCEPGADSLVGTYCLTDFLSRDWLARLTEGRTLSINDIAIDPETAPFAAAYGALGIRAQIHAPYLSDGRWKFLLCIQSREPRAWRQDEVDLMRELSARIWLRLERARAEEAHRASEERYRLLFHSIDEGFCVLEVLLADDGSPVDYRWLEVNSVFEEQTGLHDLVGRTVREMLPDLDESWFRIYENVVRTGTPIRFENHASPIDRWFDVYAFCLGRPEDRQLALLLKDITAAKKTESVLRESEERFRRMADSAPAMLWVTDRARGTTFLSRGWFDFTGLPPGEDLDHVWVQPIHPDDRDAALQTFLQSATRREGFSIDYRLRRADGEYRWVSDTGRPLADDDGGYIGSVIDVHERKLAEEALRNADRRKDEFIATLAHELRNPLAPLRNSLDILRMEQPDSVRTDRIKAIMERQVNHLTRLVDDLLEASRITRGRIELKKTLVELAAIVDSAVEASRPAIDNASLELEVSLPEEPVMLEADPVRLAQVLGNLLNNAAKYTNQGGRVMLDARREGTEVLISVRDTGIGLPSDQLEAIFDMFSQVDASAARARGGLGIGLSLVRGLVNLHGGSVKARSDGPGRGSEFLVRLPLAAGAVRSAEPAAHGSHHLRPHSRLLVADDNRDAADSLGALLELMGAEPHVVYDGPSALEAFEAESPPIVLLDIGMPGMDGYEVARRLREMPAGRQATLIALTGWGQDADRRRTREAGFDHHLLKPVSVDALQAVLSGSERRFHAGCP